MHTPSQFLPVLLRAALPSFCHLPRLVKARQQDAVAAVWDDGDAILTLRLLLVFLRASFSSFRRLPCLVKARQQDAVVCVRRLDERPRL